MLVRTHASGSSPPAGSCAAGRWTWSLREDSAELQGSAVSPPPPSQQQQHQAGKHRAAPGRFDLVPIETAGCSSLVQREGTGTGGSRYGLFLWGHRGTGGLSLLGISAWCSWPCVLCGSISASACLARNKHQRNCALANAPGWGIAPGPLAGWVHGGEGVRRAATPCCGHGDGQGKRDTG